VIARDDLRQEEIIATAKPSSISSPAGSHLGRDARARIIEEMSIDAEQQTTYAAVH
jgi:hypothetical protein